jgi:exodeoxyribonuclease V gamma subunit
MECLYDILQLYWKGLSEPIHFFPETSYVYAQKVLTKNQLRQSAYAAAQKRWKGTDFSYGESQDPYFSLLFGKTDPLDDAFTQLSEAIFNPLFSHCEEKKI